ncbi:hypothetical protein AAII07_49935 [Microvirga sp. 0TCS3.31]
MYRTKRRFVEGNLERTLSEKPRPGASRKLSGPEEAWLVLSACARVMTGLRSASPGVQATSERGSLRPAEIT